MTPIAHHQHVRDFAASCPFAPDDFQLRAMDAVALGRSVLVAAPTSSGKTLVAEFAADRALRDGGVCIYTTPIKALSNQKFRDLGSRFGTDRVGLLTGDVVINGDAPVLVMTTEVLRNMVYAGSPALARLTHVVFDEVHYLSDRERGAVWEEALITLPQRVQVVALSATVSNVEEIGAWLGSIRGATDIVVHEQRPVPLEHHMLVSGRLLPVFDQRPGRTRAVNPTLVRNVEQLERLRRAEMDDWQARRGGRPQRADGPGAGARGRRGGGGPGGRGGRRQLPDRPGLIRSLAAADLLPCIDFIFSRAGCDDAVEQCAAAGVRLTNAAERDAIRQTVRERCAGLPDADLDALDYDRWTANLERGIAAHHAGLLPLFKETVEDLMIRGLVKMVFATETLSLGINVPARSVVVERLDKWDGTARVPLTPAQYTQFTGRAGRRGIDTAGHAIVLWEPGLEPTAVAGLVSSRTYRLTSSFRLSYNMTVNLARRVGRAGAPVLLDASLAQFQARANAGRTPEQVERDRQRTAELRAAAACTRGDYMEYARMRAALDEARAARARDAEAARRAAVRAGIAELRRGDVIIIAGRRGRGPALVIGIDGQRLRVLTAERSLRRMSPDQFRTPPIAVGHLSLGRGADLDESTTRREFAQRLREFAATTTAGSAADAGEDPVTGLPSDAAANVDALVPADEADLQRALHSHPCHRCPDRADHAAPAQRLLALERRIAARERAAAARSVSLGREFDRCADLLESLGYLQGDTATPAGTVLARLYGPLDLVLAEVMAADTFADLDPAELAAVVSGVTWEPRTREDERARPDFATERIADAAVTTATIAKGVRALERSHGLTPQRPPDFGLAGPLWRWASGRSLASVLEATGMTPGDFVRACKQVVDALGQIAAASDDPALRRTARVAAERVGRGVVAYAMVAATSDEGEPAAEGLTLADDHVTSAPAEPPQPSGA